MNPGVFYGKRKLVWGLAAMLLALCVALTGCGAASSTGNQVSQGTGTDSPSAKTETRTIKHAMGETTIQGTPKKVVVLTNEGTEALLALGIKPVGAVRSWTGNPWYDHIQKDMEGVTVLGDESQPNIELIAGLKPDLILGNKLRHEKIYEQLKSIAPTVFSETLRGEWKLNFSLYAEATGKKAEGEQIIGAFDKRVEDFKQKAGDKLNQKVSVVRFMAGKTRIYLTDTFSGVIMKQIGIARTANKSKETFVEEVTKERIPDMDADLLFYFTYETGDSKGTKTEEEWTKEPLWQNLNVVKKGKAFRVSDAIWNTAGGVKAANLMLDDLYKFYEVKP